MRALVSRELVLAVMSCAALGVASGSAFAQDGATLKRILADKSPAVVMVKFVLKMTMGSMGDQESEMEVPCSMASADGLVLCSNTRLGGFMGLFGRFGGQDFSAKPTDIKVLVGDDNEGVDADFLARDSELDLAWIRIKEPAGKYAFVDFHKGAKLTVGEEIVCVDRMDKYFDRAGIITVGRIAGVTRKPRELYLPMSGALTDMGVPVFNLAGEVAGVSVLQMPDQEDMGSNPMSMLGRMSGLGGGMNGMILPAAEVAKGIKRALETASSKPADDEPTTKPAGGKKTRKAAAPKPTQADE